MFNSAAVQEWKRLVGWFPSYGAKHVVDAERKFRENAMFLRCYGKL